MERKTKSASHRLSLQEAVAYLNKRGMKIARQTLYNKLGEGKGPWGCKIGMHWSFRRTDLNRWLKAQIQASPHARSRGSDRTDRGAA